MDTQPISNCCPKCHTPLPPDAPQGLCPKCLFAAVANPTETGQPAGHLATPPPLEEIAAAFPQLEILEFIGQGGMGFVFKARQPKLDRLVALKILPQSLAADPTFAERFNREARLLARLNHPGIVTVHDFGVVGQASRLSDAASETSENSTAAAQAAPNQTGGTPVPLYYLLMEFVDGVNLRQAMQAGRFTPEQALTIVPKICEALQFAHNEGILHRDIKPENILLDAKGRVKIADFGIAKLVVGQVSHLSGEAHEFPSNSESSAPTIPNKTGETPVPLQPPLHTLTEAGKVLGTPNYMAPEQLENAGDVDHRADIYSLGVVFYEMLTGELPRGRFAPPSQKSAADPRVDEVVLRALEKEKTKRPASAEEVRTQVETIATTPRSGGCEPAPTERGIRKAESGKQTEPRFSRMAIVGAAWSLALGLCALLQNIGLNTFFIGPLSLLAPIITTALGWIAISQIRRSSGRLCGMALALFDALVFPLLACDAAILFVGLSLLTSKFGSEVSQSPLVNTAALSVILVIDYFIVRTIWFAVVQPTALPATATGKPGRRTLRAVVISLGCLSLVIGSYLYMSRRSAELGLLANARQLSLACIIYANDHTNELPAKLDDVKAYVGTGFDISKFVLVATGKLDKLSQPSHQAVLLRSVKPDKRGRHVIAFADGHAEWRGKLGSEELASPAGQSAAIPPTPTASQKKDMNTFTKRDYFLIYAWDVSYNLTTNVASLDSRWQLLLSAISKLRDEGLKEFPNDVLIHRELAWLFQHRMSLHKVGGDTSLEGVSGFRQTPHNEADSDQIYFRYQWLKLVEQAQIAGQLQSQLKLDPALLKSVDDKFGPLDWRLPETHAIYWAYQGLNSTPTLSGDDLKTLQRIIHQSLQASFLHGRIVSEATPFEMRLEHNLDLSPKVDADYEQQLAAAADEPDVQNHIRIGHRNFLLDAVVSLHEAGRKTEAASLYDRLAKMYPDKPIVSDDPKSLPAQVTCEEFVRRKLNEK